MGVYLVEGPPTGEHEQTGQHVDLHLRRRRQSHLSIPIELDVRKELEMKNIHDELVYRVAQEEPSQLALYVEGVTAYHAQGPEVRFLLKTDDQQSIRVLCVELDTDYGVTPNLSVLRYTPYLDAFLNRKIQAV